MNPYISVAAIITATITVLAILCFVNSFRSPVKKLPVKLPGICFELIYTDTRGKNKRADTFLLKSETYGICGKPDFIYRNRLSGNLIVAEIKSGKINADVPHRSNLMQLAAYFLLAQDVYGKKCKTGYLIYKDFMFKVKNTSTLRKQLLHVLTDMKDILGGCNISSHAEPSFIKCRNCICRETVCEFSNCITEGN
ncbi:MAG: CRISPR-associated protein Cas4 [Clostridiales bacterium]|jgi:CRISPR-associated exonuclease Cas4|nr:CRISPR-associated protein Cas4 [Clostridiales bacterium]